MGQRMLVVKSVERTKASTTVPEAPEAILPGVHLSVDAPNARRTAKYTVISSLVIIMLRR